MPLTLTLALLIGASLGVLGGGGTIVTTPMLVYVAGIDPRTAIPMSLLVVGMVSLAGAIQKAQRQEIHGRAIWLFAITGIPGALLGAQFTHLLSPRMLMLVFAGLMFVVAVVMLRQKPAASWQPAEQCRPWRCAGIGLGVGVLTGFLGVGGGFLLVPALLVFGRLPLNSANGTALAIIAINSLSGFAAHREQARSLDGTLTFAVIAAALLGMLLGIRFTRHLPAARLNQAFGWFVLLTATLILFNQLH